MEHLNPWTTRPYSAKYFDILKTRKTLPVFAKRNELKALVEQNQVVVVVGETGSGKTTQIPQLLLEDLGNLFQKSKIAVTQPRRIAATSVATRVAEEMDVVLGQQVGYSVRFDQKHHAVHTKIKYLTDGMLLREALVDPGLNDYSIILIDEAHERTLSSDVLMGLLKKLCLQRPISHPTLPMRVVIMSATLDAETFSKYYWNAPTLFIPGRTFPVEIVYLKEKVEDYVDSAVETVVNICKKEPKGDILVFLTGQDEIEDVCRALKTSVGSNDNARDTSLSASQKSLSANEKSGNQKNNEKSGFRAGEIAILPLYSTLPPNLQQRVFLPSPTDIKGKIGRKIIVATNIAETSLTIDGVVFVVDCGLSKQNVFNPLMNAESLLPSPISQASAQQRSGRAGRTRPGKCFRLYTKDDFEQTMVSHANPAIITSNIASVVLLLKRLKIDDLVRFDFLTPPAPATMMRALELLYHLNALTRELELTIRGTFMSEFPLDPPLAACLIQSLEMGSKLHREDPVKFRREDQAALVNAMLTLVAMLSVPPCFVRPLYHESEADKAHAAFHHPFGDHLTLVNVFHEYINICVASDSGVTRGTGNVTPKHEISIEKKSRSGNSLSVSMENMSSLGIDDELRTTKKTVSTSSLIKNTSPAKPDSMKITKRKVRAQKTPSSNVDEWCYDNYLNARSLSSALNVRQQLAAILISCQKSSGASSESISFSYDSIWKQPVRVVESLADAVATAFVKVLVSCYFLNSARKMPDSNGQVFYETLVNPHQVLVHPSSVLAKKKAKANVFETKSDALYVIYHEHIVTSKFYLRTVTAVPDKNFFLKGVPDEWLQSIQALSNQLKSEGLSPKTPASQQNYHKKTSSNKHKGNTPNRKY